MEHKTGAIPIRMVIAMTTIAKPLAVFFQLPRISFSKLSGNNQRRRQTTIDLIHSSPYLKRDIGLLEEHFTLRHR
jgi:hypothetical protein